MNNERLIDIEIGKEEIARIDRRLGELRGTSPSILKKEINKAADQMKKSLSRAGKKKYANTNVGMLRDAMDVKRAKTGNLMAVIEAKGHPLPLIKFQTAGGTDGKVASAKVLRKSKMEELTNTKAQPPIKAFITTISRKKKGGEEGIGHEGVFQRVEKEERLRHEASRKEQGLKISTLGRRYIRELRGPSIPHILGLRDFPEEVKEDTMTQLHRSIENHVAQMLGGSDT